MVDTLNGSPDGSKGRGAAISIFIMFISINIIYWKRDFFINKISFLPPVFISVLSGLFLAEVNEIVCYPFNSLFPGVSFLGDVILTIPIYLFTHIFWYLILRKYNLSIMESFVFGGLSLGLYEVFLGGGPISILTLII